MPGQKVPDDFNSKAIQDILKSMPKLNIPTGTISDVQAMLGDLAKASMSGKGLAGTQPGVVAALAKASSASNIKSMAGTGSIIESQRAVAAIRAVEPQTFKVAPIPPNPLIAIAREQNELQQQANEALAKNNESLGRVITTLETELAEAREETRTSRLYTKIALAIAAAGIIVSVVLALLNRAT